MYGSSPPAPYLERIRYRVCVSRYQDVFLTSGELFFPYTPSLPSSGPGKNTSGEKAMARFIKQDELLFAFLLNIIKECMFSI